MKRKNDSNVAGELRKLAVDCQMFLLRSELEDIMKLPESNEKTAKIMEIYDKVRLFSLAHPEVPGFVPYQGVALN